MTQLTQLSQRRNDAKTQRRKDTMTQRCNNAMTQRRKGRKGRGEEMGKKNGENKLRCEYVGMSLCNANYSLLMKHAPLNYFTI